ncbi:hypothetical protein RN001_012243 [Aquatica leii]|uniref:Uncharacterized protein n=1 Tax=Aquatica leii TaxID=1421715 RepID=A0AAN7S7P5_9COLE|nr:hypothetical protein RN001_012243 [Aquatica leii]
MIMNNNNTLLFKEENTKLTKKVDEQNERIEMLEREIRGKNLIIKGIKEDINECEVVTREKVCIVIDKIGISLDKKMEIDEAKRLGKPTEGKTRPILIKLIKTSTKKKDFKQRKKFKRIRYLDRQRLHKKGARRKKKINTTTKRS